MIRLREGIEADAGRLFELDRICFDAGIAYSLREFRSLLRSPRARCVIAEEFGAEDCGAEDCGRLAGFVIAQETAIRKTPGAHIVTIDVAPGFRRRGVGRALMEEIEARMMARGKARLRLEVAVDNSAAYAFYLGLGYSAVGRIARYYLGSIDAISMEKDIGVEPTFIRQPFMR